MQIVYISNRVDIARETLVYVENLMPFITEAVFVCPGSQVKDFHFKSTLSVKVIDEAVVLGKNLNRFRDSADHVIKNCVLRLSLVHVPEIQDEFIMSDDDNRPLTAIPFSFYKSSDRYSAYYFYDLKKWPMRQKDFDLGQHKTSEILIEKGYSTLSYSAHMPQIINKQLLGEVANVFGDSLDKGIRLEEWNAYFNYGQTVYPEMFHRPKPFKTLCWPPFPSDWEYDVRPDEFCFENFYPMLYENGLIFSGLPTQFDGIFYAEIAREKIRRRTELQSSYETGKLPLMGKMFFFFRDMAARFPRLKRRFNELIPPSRQAMVLYFFLDGSSKKLKNR